MTPHTLCIIEPDHTALPAEAEQLGGLVVTTLCARDARSLEVAPETFVTYPHPTKSCRGTRVPPGVPVSVLIPQEWLRPLDGQRVGLPVREGQFA